MLSVIDRNHQQPNPSLLGSAQSLVGLLLQGRQERLISHAIARHKGFNLTQSTIRPDKMSTRLKLGGRCRRRHESLRRPFHGV
jgi:hypothetical protein